MVKSSNTLCNLDKEQLDAVYSHNNVVCVDAGVGAGKTTVFVQRISKLLSDGVSPRCILAITTSRDLWKIRRRFANDDLSVLTFPAFCLQIIKASVNFQLAKKDYTVYDEHDKRLLIMNVLEQMNARYDPVEISDYISHYKQKLCPEKKSWSVIYKKYQALLKHNNAYDKDDLPLVCLKLLQNDAFLTYCQFRFSHILIDDFQELTNAQIMLIYLFSSEATTLFVLGDSLQKDFTKIFKKHSDCKFITFNKNYVSSKKIIQASNKFLNKKIKAVGPAGQKINVFVALHEQDEAQFILKNILEQTRLGFRFKDIVIFVTNSYKCAHLENLFIKAGIPYKIQGVKSFYLKKEIKEVLAFAKFLTNPNDRLSFVLILKKVLRPAEFEKIKNFVYSVGCDGLTALKTAVNKKIVSNSIILQELFGWFCKMRKKLDIPSFVFLQKICENNGYKSDDITRLIKIAQNLYNKGYKKISDFLGFLIDDNDMFDKEDKITIATHNHIKDIESPIVFFTSLADGIFPNKQFFYNKKKLEEEKRLFYSAMIRTKSKLFLSCSVCVEVFQEKFFYSPSRFLDELPVVLLEYSEHSFGVEF